MKFKHILFFISLIFFSCSEKEVEYKNLVERNGVMYEVNSEDPYSGKSYELYENQQSKFKGSYDDGLKDGVWEYFLDNGQITERAHYSSGKLDGSYEKYNDKNILMLKTNYVDSLLQGDYIEYNAKGDVLSEGIYEKNKKQGIWKFYYNGNLTRESNYQKGLKEGKEIQYTANANGQFYKFRESYFKNNQLNGLTIDYDDKGNTIYTCNMTNDKKDGVEERFLSNGTKVKESKYVLGELKKKKSWTDDGTLTFEGEYPGNCIWYSNGNKKAEAYFITRTKLKESTLKVWFNGNIFTTETLQHSNWQGKSHYKKPNGIWKAEIGYIYHYFNEGRYYKRLRYKRGNNSYSSPLNTGQWKINASELPTLSLRTIKIKSRFTSKPEFFTISDFDGNSMTVNSRKWIKAKIDQ